MTEPIPMTARSKASICGRSLAVIVDSNQTGAWMSALVIVVCCQVEFSLWG
jgi:hypothetical protein